ncbi:MAG: dihydrofolate reductase family protein [Actinobacteria bacterium]|nr:dihydrofolate reductase family protein [Actinomycetota bacterium]
MADRPYTLLSASMSLDGYLDGDGGERLQLSNAADFDRVDAVRAGCDAILVGANTVRRDNPRLLIKSAARRQERAERGQATSPAKVTITRCGRLPAEARFFTCGNSDKYVYCPTATAPGLSRRLQGAATIVPAGDEVDIRTLLEDLSARGVNRLMVEGGGTMHTQFLTAGLVDELQLVVAPLFVGSGRARRFVDDGCFPWSADNRATLADVQRIGDVVLLRYALSPRFGRS